MRKILSVTLIIFIVIPCLTLATTKRSQQVTTEFKSHWKCPSTGVYGGKCPGFIMDHKIPLSCGGPDEWRNLQWQSVAEARAKDLWERKDCSLWVMK